MGLLTGTNFYKKPTGLLSGTQFYELPKVGTEKTTTPAQSPMAPSLSLTSSNSFQTSTPAIAKQDTPNLLNTVGNLVKDTFRSFTQGSARIGAELGRYVTGNNAQVNITPQSKTEQIIFGNKPITGFQQYGEETLGAVGVPKKIAGTLGVPVGVALTALDVYPGGSGGKQVAEKLAKETSEEVIKNILKTEVKNIAISNIDNLAAKIAKTTDVGEVSKLLQSSVSENINPLLQEAKKYKSAEEFVNQQVTPFGGFKRSAEEMVFKNLPDGTSFERGGLKFVKKGDKIFAEGKNAKDILEKNFVGVNPDGSIKLGMIYNEAYFLNDAGIDIKSQLTDIWKKANTNIKKETVERGFISSVKDVVPEANKVAGQYVPRSTDNLAIKAKNLIKADINLAEKMALEGTDDNAVAVASELIKHYGELASQTTDQALKNSLYDATAKIANNIAPKLTEQGRAIQAASILGRLTPEGQVRFAAGLISKYNEGVSIAKKIPELTGEQAGFIVNEMKAINGMAEGVEKAMRFQKLQDYVSKLIPSSLYDKIVTVWKAGLLTGLKTTGVNIFANVSHAGSEIVKDAPAAMVDAITSLFTGKRTTTFTAKGAAPGAKEGVGKGWQYLKTGFDERNIGTKLDYKKVNFGDSRIGKALQAYTDSVFKVLGSEDQPFYYAAKLRSLYGQAKAQAINLGLKGSKAQEFIDDLIKNPTADMIKYAALDAETAVFQNKTALGAAARQFQKAPLGEIIVPFGRTPSAVTTQIINYSPVGIAKTIIENIGKGKFDQRLFSQGIGRGLTGTAVLGMGAYLMKKGLLALDRPTTEREQELWKLEGKQPNSIKIGDKWRQVQVLGPLGNVLLIGGQFQDAFNKTGSLSQAASTALAGAARSLTQQTFLTGVSNFIDAISDPARSAKNVLSSTLASVVPTIVSDTARAMDDKERRANSILERFQVRIPGLRNSLEPQIDALGRDIETQNPLEVMIDPTRPVKEKTSPVTNELRRLWDAGYKVSPTLLGDKQGYSSLTKEQNTELWRRAGEIIDSKLGKLITLDDYEKLSDEKKAKYIDNFVDKSKTTARAEMVLKLTQGLKGDELKKKLSELKASKLMNEDVFNLFKKLYTPAESSTEKTSNETQSNEQTSMSTATKILGALTGAKTASAAYAGENANDTPLTGSDLSINRLKEEVAFREADKTIDDPYKSIGPTGDIGRYQVSPPTLKSFSKLFLGKEVSKNEFLNSPELQEKFMEEEIKYLYKNGARSLDAFLVLHHRGFGDKSFNKKRIQSIKNEKEMQNYLNNRRN